MSKTRRNKGKNSYRSNSSMENAHGSKVGKLSVDTEVGLGDTPSQVSQVLNEANSVLYETTGIIP